MHIIMGSEAAERLKENYTVLELETFEHKGQKITCYCVVDQIPLLELPELDRYKQLHADFIAEYNAGNYEFCKNCAEHLIGKFNGDLDSFYEILMSRFE